MGRSGAAQRPWTRPIAANDCMELKQMSTRTTSRLESLSNLAVIIAALALLVVLARREWPGPQPGSAASLQGATIQLASLTHAPSKRNFILFVSEMCHFCEQEMPFYRSLRDKLPSRASLIAVFPTGQPAPEGFLAARQVKVDHVVSSDILGSAGVIATPTLLLVDERGTVKRAWVGAQSDRQHTEIVESIVRD